MLKDPGLLPSPPHHGGSQGDCDRISLNLWRYQSLKIHSLKIGRNGPVQWSIRLMALQRIKEMYLSCDIRQGRFCDTCHAVDPGISRPSHFRFIFVDRTWWCKNMLIALKIHEYHVIMNELFYEPWQEVDFSSVHSRDHLYRTQGLRREREAIVHQTHTFHRYEASPWLCCVH